MVQFQELYGKGQNYQMNYFSRLFKKNTLENLLNVILANSLIY